MFGHNSVRDTWFPEIGKEASQLKTLKRTASPELSKWYMGILLTSLVEKKDTEGVFSLLEATLAPGNEPPPHVHTLEDELFYVLEGEFDVYVGEEALKLKTGECIILPKFKPHAFVIRSPQLRVLILYSPGGVGGAFCGESTPAQNLDLLSEAITYSMSDLDSVITVCRY